MSLLHRLAHWFRINGGRVVHYPRDGHWFLAFECAGCGQRKYETHMNACDCRKDLP